MHSGFVVAVGLVGAQCIAAALVMHDRIDDILTAISSVLS
jgi:hypothetical protein